MVDFLAESFHLEMIFHNKEDDFVKFKLPSELILEVLGPKNIWHPFTTPPDWEVIIADIQYMKVDREL